MPFKSLSHKDYTVAWICALPKERAAAHAMLDEEHESLSQPDRDQNTYTLGSIGNHNIVIACLPSGDIGNNAAANTVTQMINTFPSIKFGLMVGIGAGIPSRVRLGDIVVSKPSGTFTGVVQWDLGKSEKPGFKRTGALDRPPKVLLTALAKLEAFHDMHDSQIPKYLQDMADKYPKLVAKYTWSPRLRDPMLELDIPKANLGMDIHYGLIASGNQVIKNGIIRDQINQSLGGEVLCIEMEAAGLMNNFPCIIIRGICDYADEQKNNDWQEYAAAIAAGFTKEFLQHVRSADVDSERPVKDVLQKGWPTSQFQEGVSDIQRLMDKVEVRKILDWLTTANYGQQHDMHSATHKEGTGRWILETDEFQFWFKNSKQKLLCRGMPGAGKTIITSVVIDYLVDMSKRDSGIGLAYIYCSFKQPKSEQTIQNLLSSVLKQLASDRQPFPATTRRLYEQHQAKQTHASQEQLISELETVIGLYSHVYVIIDALDECDFKPMHSFIAEIFNLQQHCNLNIFATSRSIPEITKWFSIVESSFLEIRARPRDIATYLEDEMKQSSTSLIKNNLSLQEDIKQEISQAADGMFLLAQIYLNLLQDKINVKEIREELHAFRSDALGRNDDEKINALTHAYDKVINRINEQSVQMKDFAMKVLLWVTFAKRALTTSELRHGLATKQGMNDLDHEDLPDLGDIGRVCVGLVSVDQKSGIIQLVHYTAQKYFENTQSRWFPGADSVLLGACITYLSFEGFESGFCQSDSEFEERQTKYPLCNYAASNWGNHATKDEKPSKEVLEFLKSPAKVEASVQAQLAVKQYSSHAGYSQEVPRRVTALHLAAHFGLTELTRVLLEDKYKYGPNSRDSYDQTPLLWATRNGHEDAISLLLDVQAAIEVRDREQGATPLIWAARNGYVNVVRLLIERGGDVNAKDNSERTPLSLAALYKHKDGEHKETPLIWAARKGHKTIVKMLLDAGADVNVKEQHLGETALTLAIESGHEETIQALLDNGANIHHRDHFDHTPLFTATWQDSESVMQLLLDRGADVSARNEDGQTPIFNTCAFGNVELVKLLLDAGADIDVMDEEGRTPLFFAAALGHREVVSLLLQRDIDVNLRDKKGRTALFSAIGSGEKDVVNLLLGTNRVDIYQADEHGTMPIDWAKERGNRDIIQLLHHQMGSSQVE
ncbi:uncharacterized protein TRIVIDRAFT_162206 [Trichoderma virens Gv29-8]|uniref:Uncharacterized protein n=1 Tax=Hypocrea virens (strain Gv29-8 / FGSC 10586) TaxID=413071 RepID=G9NAD1_HYPVG|nr:uncharacterized protein TRIVIDRAFT_162206 [Trichoderma virens Gv29-8]EHK16897.1 hypothetical protein TRIVIDRAFT_162206 [Trichoderma virens Gv29-8]